MRRDKCAIPLYLVYISTRVSQSITKHPGSKNNISNRSFFTSHIAFEYFYNDLGHTQLATGDAYPNSTIKLGNSLGKVTGEEKILVSWHILLNGRLDRRELMYRFTVF